MTTRALAHRRGSAADLERRIADARARTIVLWRGERIGLDALPERVARLDDRMAREHAYALYGDALDALNPLYAERLEAWRSEGDPIARAREEGTDPVAMSGSLERFSFNVETPYYAALRRYLALIGIEQGDATEADLWHIERGSSWSSWFGPREVRRALAAVRRAPFEVADIDGWRAVAAQLRGQPSDAVGGAVVGAAFATVVADTGWLTEEIGVAPEEVAALVDFATFVRLMHLRRAHAELIYELRLHGTTEAALQRAYYGGIVGHHIGAKVTDAAYLAAIGHPFASVRRLEVALLGAMVVEVLEERAGPTWWREDAAFGFLERVRAATSIDDTLAQLGYDAIDWRPVLRQIRTRLIGEMSGYGGPNITTRAGTRKV